MATMNRWLTLLMLFTGATSAATPHPFDDLSAQEITEVVSAIKSSGKFTADIRFPILATKEPPKAEYLRFEAGGPMPPRRAFVVVFEVKANETCEVVVVLKDMTLESVKKIPGVQPPILIEEYERLDRLVRADPSWQAAMRKRGIDPAETYVDGWAPGLLSPQERKSGARLMRGLTYYKGKTRNFYSRPVEGVIVTVEMNHDRVVSLWDDEKIAVAPGVRELDAKSTPDLGRNLKPLVISQPKGPSFKREGELVEWDHWRFRFALHPMKGLVLYDVQYRDGNRYRKIMYKGSLSEMVVPYGDKDRSWAFRNAFDVGEYGLGRYAHSLQPGVDVPEHADLLDAVFADDVGGLIQIPRATAVYERDGGLLWTHMDYTDRSIQGRRGRELVVTFTTTIGNYDYGISWIFHQDGSLDMEAHLTGMMLAKGSLAEKDPCTNQCKHLVEPRIEAPNHQHFFAFRLDMDVDGAANTPVEINTQGVPLGKNNPFANAFEMKPTYIRSEKSGGRDLSLANARKWKIINPDVRNRMDHPTGYMLVPEESAVPYLHPSSTMYQRARFLKHNIWLTRFHDEEQSAAGEYPNQNYSSDGVERWQKDNESLDKEDVVLWYVFGVTHIARPEEWPVMNAHRTGFKLMPANFFSGNPAASD